jgi:hypothetical protein
MINDIRWLVALMVVVALLGGALNAIFPEQVVRLIRRVSEISGQRYPDWFYSARAIRAYGLFNLLIACVLIACLAMGVIPAQLPR